MLKPDFLKIARPIFKKETSIPRAPFEFSHTYTLHIGARDFLNVQNAVIISPAVAYRRGINRVSLSQF